MGNLEFRVSNALLIFISHLNSLSSRSHFHSSYEKPINLKTQTCLYGKVILALFRQDLHKFPFLLQSPDTVQIFAGPTQFWTSFFKVLNLLDSNTMLKNTSGLQKGSLVYLCHCYLVCVSFLNRSVSLMPICQRSKYISRNHWE